MRFVFANITIDKVEYIRSRHTFRLILVISYNLNQAVFFNQKIQTKNVR